MKSFIYWTADLKSSELWSSQLWTQFKQLRIEAWKSQDFNGVWTRDLVIPVLHFTSILHGLIRTHKWPAPNVGGFIAQGLITRADYMVSFSPGWNLAPPTGLKYYSDYMHNFSRTGRETQISERKFAEVRKHSQCAFSARAEIPFRLHGTFSDFQARLAWGYRARIFSPGWIAPRAESFSM